MKFLLASHWPTPVKWLLPWPLIGHSTGGQNWVHQHNNICVGALHFDPWCTLNLLSSHDHFSGLSLVTAPGVKIGCINTTIFVLEHSILTLGALLTYSLAKTSHIITSKPWKPWQGLSLYWCYNPHRSRYSLSPVCGIKKKYIYIYLFTILLWSKNFIFSVDMSQL